MKKNKRSILIFMVISIMILLPIANGANQSFIKTENNSLKNTATNYSAKIIEEKIPDANANNTLKQNESFINKTTKTQYKTNSTKPESKTNLTKNIKENISNSEKINGEEKTDYIYLEIKSSLKKETSSTLGKNKSVIEQNKTSETQTPENTQTKKEETTHLYYENGEKKIELKSLKKNLPEITTKETKTEQGKEIVVSSKEHIDEELRIYSNLEKETKKENIKVYWKNEEKFIYKIKYYDENENGFVDKISWIVPHLSEQIFEIILESSTLEESAQEEIKIEEIQTPIQASQGATDNPLRFEFNVSYKDISALNCTLKINNTLIESGTNIELNKTMENGQYFWKYNCSDTTNLSKYGYKEGNFLISENFEIQGLKNIYLLNKADNSIENKNQITIKSNRLSEIEFYFERPDIPTPNYTGITNYPFNIDKNIITNTGNYLLKVFYKRLAKIYELDETFGVTSFEIIAPNSSQTNNEVNFLVDINANEINKYVTSILIDYGDGNHNATYFNFNAQRYLENIKHAYSNAGNYVLKIQFSIEGQEFEITHNIEIKSDKDETKPKIKLIFPEDESLINENQINFKFEVEEENKLESCKFSIYNATYSQGNWGHTYSDLIYNHNLSRTQLDSLEKGNQIELGIKDFEERLYSWEVICLDNSSNEAWEERFFEISLNNQSKITVQTNETHYEKEALVKELIQNASTFISKENSWEKNEKEMLDDLGIIKEVKFFKKRLVQIDQDLKENVNYISDSNLKEKRIKELNEEITNISQKLPVDAKVLNKYEYVKNGNSFNWFDFLKEYLKATNTQITSSLNSLKEENQKLQNNLTISTEIKKVKIIYSNYSEEFFLIKKEIEKKPNETNTLIEIIPDEISSNIQEINFLEKVKEIKKNAIYEINFEDLENAPIKYTLKGEEIKIKDLEKTDTISFIKKAKNKSFISGVLGFSIIGNMGIKTSGFNKGVILFLILTIFLGSALLLKKYLNKNVIRKSNEIYPIFILIDNIKEHLRIDDIETAKEKYKEIQERYKLLDPKMKKKIIDKVKEVVRQINKKYIAYLIKEYKSARYNFDKEKAENVKELLRKNYFKLQKEKDKEKVIKIINGF